METKNEMDLSLSNNFVECPLFRLRMFDEQFSELLVETQLIGERKCERVGNKEMRNTVPLSHQQTEQ